jgi:predicted enzyme related to lactoylglutathione lyase
MDRLASFYAAALDLAAADRDDEHVRLESPHFQLVVRQIPGPLAARIQIGDPPEPRWDAAVKLVFFVPNIEEVRAAATAHGAAVDQDAKEWTFHGWRVWDGLDPEGNIIQFRAPAA